MSNLPLQYRLSNEKDHSFILSSWIKSARNNHINKHIPNEVFFTEYAMVIEKLLKSSQTFIAYLDDEPDTIIAYMVYQYLTVPSKAMNSFKPTTSRLVLHWVYTKGEADLYRKQGIQKEMLELVNPGKFNIIITSFPRSEKIVEKMQQTYTVIFDPFFKSG